jgi:transcriptional regulator with XRE-family HTH domain
MVRVRVVNGVGEIGRNVANNVRRLRSGQGLSTARLAEVVGEHGRPMHDSAITRIEHCNRAVDVDDLVALASALGVSPADLLSSAPVCATCANVPPPGFACRACGAEGG